MKRFSSINQFRNVHKLVHHYAHKMEQEVPTMRFRGTVKLHGTNAGVRRVISDSGDRQYICQSRNNAVGDGHYGFPAFIKDIPDEKLDVLFDKIDPKAHKITLYGEWIGPGVQGGVAISNLPEKQWVLFGAAIDEDYVELPAGTCLPDYRIYHIGLAGSWYVDVDFKAPETAMAEMEKYTLEVEAQCPWARIFKVEGIGEGIVWTCVDRPGDSDLWFKTKGDKHSATKVNKVVSVDPEKIAEIRELVSSLMTETRLRQGLEYLIENRMEVDNKYTGQYMKYIGQELKREEIDTIEASGFTWKEVWKAAGQVARNFFLAEAKKV